MRKRLFTIMQYEKNPRTGEDLNFNEAIIQKGLEHKSLTKWAYIEHDSDTYSEADEKYERERLKQEYEQLPLHHKSLYQNGNEYVEENLSKREGERKSPHWHLVIHCENSIEVEDVARYFNVKPQHVEIPRGRGQKAFYDCLEYLTHEHPNQQALGKYLYSDDKVKANFDWRNELTEYQARRALHKGKYVDDVSYCEHEVAYNGMTLKTVHDRYPDVWLKHNEQNILHKLRGSYLEMQPPPVNRINFYLCGAGGAGKGLLSEALAKTLYPHLDDESAFFHVGAKNVTFEKYDGQPVLIWDDFRAIDIVGTSNNRGHIFRLLEPHPKKSRENVKNSHLQLLNTVNIINSVQPYREFLDGLAGEYIDRYGNYQQAEDKKQVYRRFPVIIPIHEEDFDILFNNGYIYNNDDWLQFTHYKRFSCNLRKAIEATEYDKVLEAEMGRKILEPVQSEMQNFIKEGKTHTAEERQKIINEIMQEVTVIDGADIEKKLPEKTYKKLLKEKEKRKNILLQKEIENEKKNISDFNTNRELYQISDLIMQAQWLAKRNMYEKANTLLQEYIYTPCDEHEFDLDFGE